jgi:hypothetical protein
MKKGYQRDRSLDALVGAFVRTGATHAAALRSGGDSDDAAAGVERARVSLAGYLSDAEKLDDIERDYASARGLSATALLRRRASLPEGIYLATLATGAPLPAERATAPTRHARYTRGVDIGLTTLLVAR